MSWYLTGQGRSGLSEGPPSTPETFLSGLGEGGSILLLTCM